jgi:hypothetical protein
VDYRVETKRKATILKACLLTGAHPHLLTRMLSSPVGCLFVKWYNVIPETSQGMSVGEHHATMKLCTATGNTKTPFCLKGVHYRSEFMSRYFERTHPSLSAYDSMRAMRTRNSCKVHTVIDRHVCGDCGQGPVSIQRHADSV